MAYDQALAGRVRSALSGRRGVGEIAMFGGLCFTLFGRMCCGVLGSDLMVRLSPAEGAKALRLPHARVMDFTGRPMRGFLFIGADGTADSKSLRTWVQRAVAYIESLGPKPGWSP